MYFVLRTSYFVLRTSYFVLRTSYCVVKAVIIISAYFVRYFIFALVYLLLDLEILLTFPFAVSGYVNNIYGLIITLGFIIIITIGFIYELGKSALKIDSRQTITMTKFNSSSTVEFVSRI